MTERWTNLLIGAWLLLSPWLLGFSSLSILKWSNVLCGLALIIFSAWAIAGRPLFPPIQMKAQPTTPEKAEKKGKVAESK